MNEQNGNRKRARAPGFFGVNVPPEYRQGLREARLQDNLARMRWFALYIILLQIALNIINILKPSGNEQNIGVYIFLSMVCLLMGLLYSFLLFLVRRGKIVSKQVQAFLVYSLVYAYAALQMVFCTLNIMTDGTINSYVIAILILGLIPLFRPAQSLLAMLACMAYLFAAIFFSSNGSRAWNSILITDTWTNIIIITGLAMCFSVFIHRMYVANYLKSVDLQKANENLEKTVNQRTKELMEKTQAAEVASRAKSDFLARMSHEMRTPLNAITGMAQVARRQQNQCKTNESLDEIIQASGHLLSIVNDVLDMSRIESGRFVLNKEPFRLRQAALDAVSMVDVGGKDLDFYTNAGCLPDELVLGDKSRLKQVLINLLSNAVKFTPRGGRVEFICQSTEADEHHLALQFEVCDNGIGIREDEADRLFTPFEQADNEIAIRFGGAGLGLAISRNIINGMGGEIKVKSSPGKGSVFTVRLALEKTNAAEGPANAAPDTVNLHGKRILLVEDIDINRLIVVELLNGTGAQIDEAEDGLEGMKLLREKGLDYYDLIFMDIQMPNMNGYECTRLIREEERMNHLKPVPVIAMTANAFKEDIERAIDSGMNAHIAKPIDVGVLFGTLEEYLVREPAHVLGGVKGCL